MYGLFALIAIATAEHIISPLLDGPGKWEFALSAKYLSLAVVLLMLLAETGQRPLPYRSVVALFCIGAWVDTAAHVVWQFAEIDSTMPVLVLWTGWFIHTARRAYNFLGDPLTGGNVFIMLLRPSSVFAVCKALVGFPVASVCLYANGTVWGYRSKSGTFDLYPVDDRWLQKHIAINTGVYCSDHLMEMLDDLVGQRRWPGTKCIWSIRHVLARLGKTYKPRLCDYLPGIYAMRIIKGRG